MTRIEQLECDNCHKRIEADQVSRWLRVFTVVGNEEAMQAVGEAIERGEKPLDWGDFCCLRCLGEWALAQELLRELDNGGGDTGDDDG